MKFGIREICDVVLRARGEMQIGDKTFYKGEPVCYFDTLKSSSMEGASTTVYAQGGRGNSRLASWDGERTVTFTMEDALISPEGLMILTGAGLVDASETGNSVIVHKTDRFKLNPAWDGQLRKKGDFVQASSSNPDFVLIQIDDIPYYQAGVDTAYLMLLDKNGEIKSEPYIIVPHRTKNSEGESISHNQIRLCVSQNDVKVNGRDYRINNVEGSGYALTNAILNEGPWVFIDYYVEKKSNAKQINITPDVWSGYFYLEASTLFRDANTGKDLPAEFIIPKCKVQSNFTFNLSSSGDPSTFTFTMDAFPDYTRFDQSEKVFSAIQIMVDEEDSNEGVKRNSTHHGLVPIDLLKEMTLTLNDTYSEEGCRYTGDTDGVTFSSDMLKGHEFTSVVCNINGKNYKLDIVTDDEGQLIAADEDSNELEWTDAVFQLTIPQLNKEDAQENVKMNLLFWVDEN